MLAIDWSGAEGNALSLHSAEGGNQFIEMISDSWYRGRHSSYLILTKLTIC